MDPGACEVLEASRALLRASRSADCVAAAWALAPCRRAWAIGICSVVFNLFSSEVDDATQLFENTDKARCCSSAAS